MSQCLLHFAFNVAHRSLHSRANRLITGNEEEDDDKDIRNPCCVCRFSRFFASLPIKCICLFSCCGDEEHAPEVEVFNNFFFM